MSEFVITFRETLEAALIVGIIATFLAKQWYGESLKQVRYAILAAVLGSIVFARWLWQVQHVLGSSVYATLFEALLFFVTSALLLYMVAWMSKGKYRMYTLPMETSTNNPLCLWCELNYQTQQLKARTKSSIKQHILTATKYALSPQASWWIFSLIFFAIMREGFETVLFLFSASNLTGSFSFIWFFGGIILASLLWYILFVTGKRIKLQVFFTLSSVFLILFAAWMASYGVHETEEFLIDQWYLQETTIKRPWNIFEPQIDATGISDRWWSRNEEKGKRYHLLHDTWKIGMYLKWMFGYNSDPNIVEPLIRIVICSIWYGIRLRKEENSTA